MHKIRRRTATPSELLHPLKESLLSQVTDKMHLEQLNEETLCLDQQIIEEVRSMNHSVGGELLKHNSVSKVAVEAKSEVTKLMDLDLDNGGSADSPSSGRSSRRSVLQRSEN